MRAAAPIIASAVLGCRLPCLLYALAAVALVPALACGDTSRPVPSDADFVEESAGALERSSDADSDQEPLGTPASVGRTGPRFATTFSMPDEPKERGDLRLATLLPRDAIPSIDSPKFIDAESASDQMGDDDLVIGVTIEGEHKAYSTAFLSSHEIVNDVVGGRPVAVTW